MPTMGDYLYDRSGPPDPEVVRLEDTLAPLAYRAPTRRRRRWPLVASAMVAATAAAAAVAVAVLRPRPPSWAVEDLEGSPRCGGELCRALPVNQWLETDASSRARILVADLGRLDIEPGTRIRRKAAHRLEMAEGQISAHVYAPPRLLVV